MDFDPLYVAARRVLLDALQALEAHRAAVILAGAQAIYIRTGEADLAVAPFTSDGDLALDPVELTDEPHLEDAMRGAGFDLWRPTEDHPEPGIWQRRVLVDGVPTDVKVDLIVPGGFVAGGRSARLAGHAPRAARRIVGLEPVLLDNSVETIMALESGDPRAIEVKVAGVAGLLVAKAHKLHDRVDAGRQRRLEDKDASDVVRLMRTTRAPEVGLTLARLALDERVGSVVRQAVDHLEALFGRRGGVGISMAVNSLEGVVPEAEIHTLCTAYMRGLRAGLGSPRHEAP